MNAVVRVVNPLSSTPDEDVCTYPLFDLVLGIPER